MSQLHPGFLKPPGPKSRAITLRTKEVNLLKERAKRIILEPVRGVIPMTGHTKYDPITGTLSSAEVRCADIKKVCPLGGIGDQLWAREDFRLPDVFDNKSPTEVGAMSLEAGWEKPWAPVEYMDGRRVNWGDAVWPKKAGKNRNAQHMPEWASRLRLEIVYLDLLRLQTFPQRYDPKDVFGGVVGSGKYEWDQGHPRHPWASNPFVWVFLVRL